MGAGRRGDCSAIAVKKGGGAVFRLPTHEGRQRGPSAQPALVLFPNPGHGIGPRAFPVRPKSALAVGGGGGRRKKGERAAAVGCDLTMSDLDVPKKWVARGRGPRPPPFPNGAARHPATPLRRGPWAQSWITHMEPAHCKQRRCRAYPPGRRALPFEACHTSVKRGSSEPPRLFVRALPKTPRNPKRLPPTCVLQGPLSRVPWSRWWWWWVDWGQSQTKPCHCQ